MWRAYFNDGTSISEFNDDGIEIQFKQVLNRVDMLTRLSIVLDSGEIFTVNMYTGQFSVVNNTQEREFYINNDKLDTLQNVRPIYFIRETVQIATTMNTSFGTASVPQMNFIGLGIQGNVGDKNIQRYLEIYPNGRYIPKHKGMLNANII